MSATPSTCRSAGSIALASKSAGTCSSSTLAESRMSCQARGSTIAAIVYDRDRVVESLQDGVQFGTNRWDDRYTVTIGLTVNSTTLAQDAAAAEWCAGQRGKPYNYNFFDVETRDRFYCSQLVWASFHDLYGIDLNTWVFGQAIHPAELVLSDQTRTVYTHAR